MERLPVELIEKILNYPILSIEDVVRFSSVCSYFRYSVVNSTVIWKNKFFNKWPDLVDFFAKNYNCFFEEIQYIYGLKTRTMALLETMPSRFYKKYQLSDADLYEWDELMGEKPQTYHYLVLHLLEIVHTNEDIKSIEVVPLNTPGNKTLQYYATNVLRFIKQIHLSKLIWANYISLPAKKQVLEKGAIFVAQWCQPELHITEKNIVDQLNYIADFVKERLYSVNPNHQLFKTSNEELERWKTENLDKSQWSIPECRQLIVVMREAMYSELGFGGNHEDYYIPENSLINKVLESRKGLPIILAIIYEAVGRRLGLLFEPLNFAARFLLRFIEGEGRHATLYYIDTFNGGNVMQKTACPYSVPVQNDVLFPIATAAQVVERIVNNLELSTRQHVNPNGRVSYLRSILELSVVVTPQDLATVVSLAKLYSLHKINTKCLEDYLTAQTFNAPDQVQSILFMLQGFSRHRIENDFQIEKVPSQRSEDLKYAVGMIVFDVIHNDKCVIYGWNSECPIATNCLPQWPWYGLDGRPKQPFYNILVEDGSYRYVPQDALLPSSDPGDLHQNKDLGRHFSHFFGNHFVPNAEKEKEYPGDTKVRQKWYHESQLALYKP